jgi:chromosome segregation ATPase
MLTQRVRDLETENSSLKEENQRYADLISKQSGTIQGLETTNTQLAKENEESQYHIRKLQVQLSDAHEELTAARISLTSKEEQVNELETAMFVLTQELANRVKEFNERDKANQKLIKEQRTEIEGLLAKIRSLEEQNGDMNAKIVEYLKEIEYLRSKLASDTRFKQFVSIKRDYNDLKDKNDTLMFKVYEHEKVCPPMPFMTAKGRIKSAAGRRTVSPSIKRPGSASVDKLLHNRPKSTIRTLISTDNADQDHY